MKGSVGWETYDCEILNQADLKSTIIQDKPNFAFVDRLQVFVVMKSPISQRHKENLNFPLAVTPVASTLERADL